MQKKIPTITVKTGRERFPDRPFIMKTTFGIYRYGIRYNVITDNKGKTDLVDLRALVNVLGRDNVADGVQMREIELIKIGKNEFVVVNGQRYTISEILTTENSV